LYNIIILLGHRLLPDLAAGPSGPPRHHLFEYGPPSITSST